MGLLPNPKVAGQRDFNFLVVRILERLDNSPELALLRRYIVDNDPNERGFAKTSYFERDDYDGREFRIPEPPPEPQPIPPAPLQVEQNGRTNGHKKVDYAIHSFWRDEVKGSTNGHHDPRDDV